VVDEVRVLRLLRRITDDLAVLEHESRAGAARREDPVWLRGVKYTFVTAIEACVDVAHHLCAVQGWGPPSDNGDAVNLLGRHGILSHELASLAPQGRRVPQCSRARVRRSVGRHRHRKAERSLGPLDLRPRGHDLARARGGHHIELIDA
jgi:hypothetical protein